jgi:hypothetical protein
VTPEGTVPSFVKVAAVVEVIAGYFCSSTDTDVWVKQNAFEIKSMRSTTIRKTAVMNDFLLNINTEDLYITSSD